jgi:hypothetical protein
VNHDILDEAAECLQRLRWQWGCVLCKSGKESLRPRYYKKKAQFANRTGSIITLSESISTVDRLTWMR